MINARMVINMNEARLTTIEQIGPFLGASTAIDFSVASDDGERHLQISRVLRRFDYPGRNKRGVRDTPCLAHAPRRYAVSVQRTSGCAERSRCFLERQRLVDAAVGPAVGFSRGATS